MSNAHDGRLELNASQVLEMYGRIDIVEDNITKHNAHLEHLDGNKVENTVFQKAKKKLDLQNLA